MVDIIIYIYCYKTIKFIFAVYSSINENKICRKRNFIFVQRSFIETWKHVKSQEVLLGWVLS